jgi:hypothetical protein
MMRYASHEEFEDLCASLVEEYDRLIAEGCQDWTAQGTPLWLRLTKGTAAAWCAHMALQLGRVLEQAADPGQAVREFVSPSSVAPGHPMDEFRRRHFRLEGRRYVVVSSPSLAGAVR